jgi:autotransporter-associated beta strand protein
MSSNNHPFRTFAFGSLVGATLMTFPATAATISWDGSDSSAWALGANWAGDVAPANSLLTDIALFNLGTYTNQPDTGSTAINGIQIGGSSGALTLDGTSLSIGSSGIAMSSGAAAATINAPITLGAAQTWANNSINSLSVGSIAPTSGAGTAVNFTGTGVIKTTNANTNGILGAWATTGMAGTNNATGDWATVNGSGNIVAYTAYTDITGATSGAGATTQNWRATNGAASLTASATVNSLVMTTDFNIQSGATLTLGSGGMILSGASRWLKNNGAGSAAGTGQITSGLASGELFIHSSGSSATNNDWRIWTKIVNNGSTAVTLVKNGPGFLDLQNANTYTGGTIINGGELSVSNNSALGTGTLAMKGGTLSIEKAGANIDLANNIALSGINKIQTDAARNLALTSASTITGSGTLTLGDSGSNASIFLNATNSMTGGTIVMANNTNAQRISSTSFGNANVAWVFNNVTANKTTLDFTTGTVSFGSMTGAGRIQGNNATGTKTISAGALGLNDTFSGVIANGAGTVALTKVGSGTMTLSGANTYTGKTTISGGSLAMAPGGIDRQFVRDRAQRWQFQRLGGGRFLDRSLPIGHGVGFHHW